MKDIDVSKRAIGVNFDTRSHASVEVWAPLVKKVELILSEKGIKIPLSAEGELGYWKGLSDQIEEGDLYKLVIDGKEFPDPASLSQPDGVHGSSQAINITDFPWSDSDWSNIPLNDYILYELHSGTFTHEGTFLGICEKLDYLKELGINAIEIMPVAQFPGSRNWGYDGVFPFAVQNSYGGARALQNLVNTCHEKGIAVILDVVYNHMGPEGNYLGEYGPYFTEKYRTPWGNAINFDDEWCDGVRYYFIENALMWFRDFHIDALRLDAVHAIKDFSPVHILREIKLCVNQLMQETGRKHYLIVELDLNDPRFINPLEKEGYGMDAQWVDEFHHALRVTAGGEISGYYSDFKGLSHLAKAYKDAYVYDGIFSPHRKKIFGVKAENNHGSQFVVFSQNHDQVGNRMLGERTSQLVSFEMQKLLAGSVMVSPFLPMLFMGEEWGESNPFLYFVSHTDSDLAEAVRKGRKEEFGAFHAEGEAPDPTDEETFQKSKLQWELLKQESHLAIFTYYQALIALRKQNPVLNALERYNLQVESDEEKQVLILHRWHKNQKIYCFMNFSKEEQQIDFPENTERWKKIFDSADSKWKGPGASPESISASSSISIHPESLLIYSNS
jgi:maltooligosyltrehalose trehalohydrolase